MKVKIYIEGGGESKSLHIKCREAFRKLIERMGFTGRMPATKACGSRNAAYEDFKIALRTASADEYPLLLVDSEGPVSESPWQHLHTSDGWSRPEGAGEAQVSLMVQCMETWCAADRKALREVFGSSMNDAPLPPLNDLEAVPKDRIQEALQQATRPCGKEKSYRKGQRSFDVVARLDPAELTKHLPHFEKFRKALDERLK